MIGETQFRKAVDLFNEASEQIKGTIDFQHAFLDFSQLEVTINKGGTSESVKTCPAAVGFAFAAGTTDGPAFDFRHAGDDKICRYNILKKIIFHPPFSICYILCRI